MKLTFSRLTALEKLFSAIFLLKGNLSQAPSLIGKETLALCYKLMFSD